MENTIKKPTVRDLIEAAANSNASYAIERRGDEVVIRLEEPLTYVEVRGQRYLVADIY